MRANDYEILSRAVSEGIRQGWNRSHKYSGEPSEEEVFQQIEHAIMLNASEVFFFNGPTPERED